MHINIKRSHTPAISTHELEAVKKRIGHLDRKLKNLSRRARPGSERVAESSGIQHEMRELLRVIAAAESAR
jgi:hypothetical protein